MTKLTSFIAGLGAGVAAMYLWDPERGAERRSRATGKATHYGRLAATRIRKGSEEARSGWQSVQTGWRTFWRDLPVGDEVLAERVRAGMGHLLRDLSHLDISAHEGRVVLKGAVNPDEIEQIVRTATAVAGVLAVENHLESRH